MRIQYMSDLHLNTNVFLGDAFEIHVAEGADCLVLCGDLGTPTDRCYVELVAQAARKFKHVIVVAGNHEFYGGVMTDREGQLRYMCCEHPNVHFLSMDAVVLDSVRFLGCTLWSEVKDSMKFFSNDYQCTYLKPRTLVTPADLRALHAAHSTWLSHELAKNTDIPTVIVTHHAPDMRMNGTYLGNAFNSAFATDLPHIFRPPLRAWICGHTHQSLTHTTNDIPCMSNCYGNDGEETGFDPLRYVDV